MQDHLPARRDCSHCLRAQGRSRPHKRVEHPEAFTLSLDLSGKLTPGKDQEPGNYKFLLVGVYTYPVTKKGKRLIPRPVEDDPDEEDQPLPGLNEISKSDHQVGYGVSGRDEVPNEQRLPPGDGQAHQPEEVGFDLLEEQPVPEPGEVDAEAQTAHGRYDTWMKLINESKNVAVRNLTFVEPVLDRNVQNVLPAIARIYARLRSLGCPVYRAHSDRAREFVSRQTKQWFLDRGIVQTLTPGSAYKTNGRVESEMNMVKKGIRTIITANACPFDSWPLAARHIGERRLRNQLHHTGWPVGHLLRFGSKAYALKKSWQDRYVQWRDCREEVVIWGPAIGSSITTTTYYVKSTATDRCFYTDDSG